MHHAEKLKAHPRSHTSVNASKQPAAAAAPMKRQENAKMAHGTSCPMASQGAMREAAHRLAPHCMTSHLRRLPQGHRHLSQQGSLLNASWVLACEDQGVNFKSTAAQSYSSSMLMGRAPAFNPCSGHGSGSGQEKSVSTGATSGCGGGGGGVSCIAHLSMACLM